MERKALTNKTKEEAHRNWPNFVKTLIYVIVSSQIQLWENNVAFLCMLIVLYALIFQNKLKL